jgi:two-component system, NtrC family, sensor kinase
MPPPLEQRLLDVADRFLEVIKRETGHDTIVCDETGHIVRATIRSRIGDLHAGSQRIMRDEVDHAAVTAAEEAANPLVKQGMNCPIVVDGRRVGTFGIAGPLVTTRPLARVAAIILGDWLEELQRDAAAACLGREEQRRPRLLCVDDSVAFREQVQKLLGGEYDVTLASDGIEGLRAAKAHPPETVLSDFEMPGLNGLQLLLAMKSDPALKAIPFLIATASAQGRASAQLLDAGAHDFLLKSSGPEELRARVRAATRSHRIQREAQAERQGLARMAQLLARSEARTRAVIESAADAIVLLGPDGKIEAVNQAAEQMFGFVQREAVGLAFLQEFVAARSRPVLAKRLAGLGDGPPGGGPRFHAGTYGLRRGGHEFPIDCRFRQLGTGPSTGSCAFVKDLTEAQRLELDLQQARKLESVGQLAAGIAHEINTPMQYIGDNTLFFGEAFGAVCTLIQRFRSALTAGDLEAARSDVERATVELDIDYFLEQLPSVIKSTADGVARVSTIVRAMKDFAHPDQLEMVAADLNRAILATLEVARNEYRYVADVETRLEELPAVTCYAGDLNQVFLNLIVNAAHAVEQAIQGTSRRGRIEVATRVDGHDVVVTVMDTGTGIPEQIRHRIFDPFFTTKEVGKGTGQGLSIAQRVIAKHKGQITFTTQVGQGTTFLIRLPVDGPAARRECA